MNLDDVLNLHKIGTKQLLLLGLVSFKESVIVTDGAIRTGKTLFGCYGLAILIHKYAVERPSKGQNTFGVVGQANVKATHENATLSIIQMLKLLGWSCRKNDYDYVCKKGAKVVKVNTYAMNNASSFRRLQGSTLRSVFIDEAPLQPLEAIETAIGRTITFKDAKAILTGNPEGTEEHEYYKTYLAEHKEDVKVIHYTLTDNPINTAETVKKYENLFTDVMYKRKVLGKWVIAQGAVYMRFDKNKHVKTKEYNADRYTIGIDYGDNDATSAVLNGFWGVREFHAFKQYYHRNESDEKDINDYANDITKFILECRKLTKKAITVYVDSASLSFKKLIKKSQSKYPNAFIVKDLNKSKKDSKSKSAIQERCDFRNLVLNAGVYSIDPSCANLISEISNAVYDKDGVRADDKTHRVDSLDSDEYAWLHEIKRFTEYLLREEENNDDRTSGSTVQRLS